MSEFVGPSPVRAGIIEGEAMKTSHPNHGYRQVLVMLISVCTAMILWGLFWLIVYRHFAK